VTGEGFLYRVDMRLRPWGSVGPLISSLDGYLAYLERSARPWERQALLKARVITGDEALRRTFLVSTNGLLFAPGADPRVEVRAIKQRIEAQLDANGEAWGQVKLGRGSIRDVEFVTQYLQLRHGAQHPDLRSANTRAPVRRSAISGGKGQRRSARRNSARAITAPSIAGKSPRRTVSTSGNSGIWPPTWREVALYRAPQTL